MHSVRYVALIALLVLLQSVLFAADSYIQTPTGEIKGRLVVELDESLGSIQTDTQSGVAQIGFPALDALARQYRVYSFSRAFPGVPKPEGGEFLDMTRYYLLEFPVGVNLNAIAHDYSVQPGILSTHFDRMIALDYIPNDPSWGSQWALTTVQAPVAFDYCQGSTTVKVGIVDSGIDTTHSDLKNNLWVNPGEDLNHNGIIELIEWNGMDDDGNGYPDDFYGWNFYGSNNDVQDLPTSQNGGHGTHCAGDASAVTNNGVGIASLGYKAKIITARAGLGLTVSVIAAANGMNYCTMQGAKAINLSFGSSSTDPFLPGSISYAWSQGVAVFASAGNSNSSAVHYPAAYDYTVAVASTNASDQKSWFSNYGTWVDLCAPGDGILSTVPPNTYVAWDGTSFSTPITVGLAALVWAAKPSWTNQQVITHIQNTCTNINAQNPSYIGMLGTGRINAGNAIGSLYPNLSYVEQLFNDSLGGNNNHRPDPGESVQLWLTLRNTSSTIPATGVQVSVTCSDTTITLTQTSSVFGTINPGQMVNNHASPIAFTVSQTAQAHNATFVLTLTETGMGVTQVTNLVQQIGQPLLLLVDDAGANLFGPYYTQTLDSLGMGYQYWSVNSQGVPDTAYANDFPMMIWFTGMVSSSVISTTEQTLIQTYLNNGGKLFINGQNIAQSLNTASPTFLHNTLHANFGTANTMVQVLNGVAGNPIGNGLNLDCSLGGSGSGSNINPDGISVIAPAGEAFIYQSSAYRGGLTYTGTSNEMLVFFSFAYEAISGQNSTADRYQVMSTILSWFGAAPPPPPPALDVTLTPVNPPITIPANGGSFQFNAAVLRTTGPQAPFYGWARMKYPNGTYSNPTLGPVQINPPVGVTITRLRIQNIASTHPSGITTYLGYANTTFTYPAMDSSFFTFTKLAIADNGPWVNNSTCSGEPFPGEIMTSTPEAFSLVSINPNPFNPATSIRYQLSPSSRVSLKVYDMAGRLVAELVNGTQEAGTHQVMFDGSRLASGLYFVRLQSGDFNATQKMMLLK
jgi:subtilisin family serine protease